MTADPDPPATDLLATAEDLRSAVGDFVRRVRVVDVMPAGQAAVLGHLDRGGALSIADLARLEQVRHQSMTRTVNLLKDQDFVTASAGEADRRQVVIAITEAGLHRLNVERHRRSSSIAEAISAGLDAEEQRIVARIPGILRKLQP